MNAKDWFYFFIYTANHINIEGAKLLCEALKVNSTLKVLKISSEKREDWFVSLMDHDAVNFFTANDYGKRGDDMIKEVQKNHPSLKEVELHGE